MKPESQTKIRTANTGSLPRLVRKCGACGEDLYAMGFRGGRVTCYRCGYINGMNERCHECDGTGKVGDQGPGGSGGTPNQEWDYCPDCKGAGIIIPNDKSTCEGKTNE